jgi:hypothetical protein
MRLASGFTSLTIDRHRFTSGLKILLAREKAEGSERTAALAALEQLRAFHSSSQLRAKSVLKKRACAREEVM